MGRIDAVKLAACAITGIQQIHSLQLFKKSAVNFRTLTLWLGFLIPGQAKPKQILPKDFSELSAGALRIQIFHPKHHMTVVLFYGKPGDQSRKDISQMHPARRRRGEAPHNRPGHQISRSSTTE